MQINAAISPKILVVLVCALLGALSLGYAMNVNKACFEIQQDGAGWQTYLDYQSRDRAPFTQTGVDALQGSFDAYYPLINDYTIPGAIYRLLGRPAPGPLGTYAIYVAVMIGAIFLVAVYFQVSSATALLGALIAGFFFPPLIVHHFALTFRFFHLNPHWMQGMILSLGIILSAWALDGKWSPGRIILFCLPALCVTLEIMSTGAMVIFTPGVLLYGGASLLYAPNRSAFVQKLLAALLALAVIVLTGQAAYLYGSEQYSAYQFFDHEFDWDDPSLGALSIFFAAVPFGSLLIGLGIGGAALAAIEKASRLRQLAITHLVATALFFACGGLFYVWWSHHHYRGSAPFYFETTFMPFAAIFSAFALTRLLALLARFAGLFVTRVRDDWGRLPIREVTLCAFLVAVIAFNFVSTFGPNPCAGQQVYANIAPTPITQSLQRAIALSPGTVYRGSVATIDWPDDLPAISARHMNRENGIRWDATRNDHRISGLWHYNIPTLYQYFTFITAPYYLMLTEFMARPADRQTRSGLILTRLDPKMLQLWGVRYVITDQSGAIGRELVALPLKDRPPLRLVELGTPNLGNYSPTKVAEAADFHAGLLAMHAVNFDPTETVIANASLGGSLTPAIDATLTYERDGFRIQAGSGGTSLLVLPVQFSHCWTAEGRGAPQLFRADLAQLGVKFSGELDARLVFRYGPLFASACRLNDVADIKHLHIAEGRVIPRIIPAQEPAE